ncbi:MAG: sigma factor-like helix-turn-helix DNA-binding protein [Nocardioides sp.]
MRQPGGLGRTPYARGAARPPALCLRGFTSLTALPADSERFWTEVRRLPRRQAQAAALYYALELSVADVAATLGCAEGTVKSHLSRARQELARRLDLSEDPS